MPYYSIILYNVEMAYGLKKACRQRGGRGKVKWKATTRHRMD